MTEKATDKLRSSGWTMVETSGFLHPFTGLDHMLAMVGVGMWAALLAARKPVVALLMPAVFTQSVCSGQPIGSARGRWAMKYTYGASWSFPISVPRTACIAGCGGTITDCCGTA